MKGKRKHFKELTSKEFDKIKACLKLAAGVHDHITRVSNFTGRSKSAVWYINKFDTFGQYRTFLYNRYKKDKLSKNGVPAVKEKTPNGINPDLAALIGSIGIQMELTNRLIHKLFPGRPCQVIPEKIKVDINIVPLSSKKRLWDILKEMDRIGSFLPDRERQVIKLRFGLGGDLDLPLTLEAIGRNIGVTKERVRVIEARALHHLQHFEKHHMAESYVNDIHDSLVRKMKSIRATNNWRFRNGK